jgi:eukaryotic-like serine/threonine-protein kinase
LSIPPGTHLGPFEIQSALGAGGMGEVYKARDTRLDRAVAIKVLRAQLADDPERRARFEREARLISQLNHPHICTLYDVGHTEGMEYLVVEYLDGVTLAARVENGPLPIDEALACAIQIAGALEAAHRGGIVHRDLKPANVMLTKSGAKLLDFGIARLAAPAAGDATAAFTQATLTMDGAILGTPQYMSPEQIEGREADVRSDLYTFGALLYEMLTGRRASSEDTLRSLRPPALDHLVRTCLARNPDERWQSAGDVRRQLQWIGTSATTASPDAPASGTRRARNVALAAAVAALVLAASAMWALWRRPAAAPAVRETRLEISTPRTAVSTEGSLALSPDGSTVAFVGESEGQSVLWLRPLDGASRPLPDTAGAIEPFWSPDSQSIGFFTDGKLKRIDRKGGAVRILADALNPVGGSWGRDGTIVFTPHQLSTLVRVPADGGDVTSVTRLEPGQTGHLHPHLLPDGLHVLYFAGGRSDVAGVYVNVLDGTAPKRLLTGTSPALYAAPGYLLFVRDNVLLAQAFDLQRLALTGEATSVAERVAAGPFRHPAVSASDSGDIVYRGVATDRAEQLTWIDRAGALVKHVGEPDSARTDGGLSLAPDGHRAVVTRQVDGKNDLWLVDLDRDGVMRRLTLGGRESMPLWSRDGLRVTHASTRNGHLDIYEAGADGERDEQILLLPFHHTPADWSPDGRVLLFLLADGNLDPARNTHLDIWALRTGRGEKPFPLVQSPLEDINPQFGPGATWFAYQSSVSGRHEVYIRPFPGPGAPVPISIGGGTQPRLRADGKELFYVGFDHWLTAVPIAASADGRSITAGAPVRLFQTRIGGPESGIQQWQYAVTPDGQRFLFDLPVERAGAPLVLIQHWKP